MEKKRNKSAERVSIKSKIEDIENNAGVFPGNRGVAEVLKDFDKLIKRQQRQINSLENKIKRIDTRESRRHVVFCQE